MSEFNLEEHIELDKECERHMAAARDDIITLLNLLKRVWGDEIMTTAIRNGENPRKESNNHLISLGIGFLPMLSALKLSEKEIGKMAETDLGISEHDGEVSLKSLKIAKDMYGKYFKDAT